MVDRAFSHVALCVGRGEGPLAARLLRAFGFGVTDNGPSLLGDPWYTAIIDPAVHDGRRLEGLGFFVTPASDEQLAVESAFAAHADDSIRAFLAAKLAKPDSNPHVAVHYGTIAALEEAVRSIQADDELANRTRVRRVRPEFAAPDFEARLDRSDVFGTADRVRYLSDAVQVFVTTDIVSAGLLCLQQSFELDHELPRSDSGPGARNLLSLPRSIPPTGGSWGQETQCST